MSPHIDKEQWSKNIEELVSAGVPHDTLTGVDERWNAVKPNERAAWLRYGTKPAPWENAPDYAERILKGDRRLTLEGARILSTVFRAAYDELVGT